MPPKKKSASWDYNKFNRVQLIRGGSDYFSRLLKLINEATESIHLQVYILNDDDTGKEVAEALKQAAGRKVEVHVLADGYASQKLSRAYINDLRSAGIRFRFFEPVFRSRNFYFGRRMHHKVAAFDARYALVGGINVADRYNDMPGMPAWLDFALFIEGEVAKDLCVLCWKTWNGYPPKMELTPCEQRTIGFSIPPAEQTAVRMSRNDWVRHKNEISRAYIEMLVRSQKQVTILCSYFLPGKVIRRQIVRAVKRGVHIRVIAAGRSDVMLAKNAERWLYDWLLRNGIELYEYQENVLHGKIAVCDNEWVTIGSYNINNISAYASIELNLDVNNHAFAEEVRNTLEEIIDKDCIRITAEHQSKTRNIFKQFIRWVSYQFIRLVFFLFTFYFKHRA